MALHTFPMALNMLDIPHPVSLVTKSDYIIPSASVMYEHVKDQSV